MTINLTENGWIDENGNLLGEWTNSSDTVLNDNTIEVAAGMTVDTKNGRDTIRNESDSGGLLIDDNATLNTDNGEDLIFGEGFIGIDLGSNATLTTGNGNDQLFGRGFDGFFVGVGSVIETGNGNDTISGKGFAVGVGSRSRIDTGSGNDFILGEAEGPGGEFSSSTGIANFLGTIDTGSGNDVIIGKGQDIGISNSSGTIDTGNGNDIVDALSGGFADRDGTGQINLGSGLDIVRGFGDHRGTVDGGSGFDKAELGFSYDENLISFGSTGSTSLDITFESQTMSFDNFEVFNFNGQEFSLAELQAQI